MANRLLFLILLLLSLNALANQKMQKKIDDLESQILDLRLKELSSKFSFSGDFITRYDSIRYIENSTSTAAEIDRSNVRVMQMLVNLNFDAQVNQNVKFYSSINMRKNFNAFTRTGVTTNDNPVYDVAGSNETDKGPAAFIDKAYIDYNLLGGDFSLSIGRFPTTQGPPEEVKDDLFRQGTYPTTAYNFILDGYAATYKFDKYLPKNHKLRARLLHTPLGSINFGTRYQNVTHKDKDGNTVKREDFGKSVAAMIDYQHKHSKLYEQFDFIFLYYHFGDVFPPTSSFSGSNLADLRTDISADQSVYSFNFIFKKLFKSNFDAYLVVNKGRIKQTGDTYCSQAGFGAPPNCNGNPIGTGFGVENDDKDSEAYLFGAVYTLPTLSSRIRIGVEHSNVGNTFPVPGGTNIDPTSFYYTRGRGTHGFASITPSKNTYIRFGYMDQRQTSKQGSTRMFDRVDYEFKTIYSQFRVLF